jgi:hypothetical protein
VRRVSKELDSGCIYISGAVEFDDRPGPVRDALAAMVLAWHNALARAIRLAADAGQLRPDVDVAQILFEMHGLILACTTTPVSCVCPTRSTVPARASTASWPITPCLPRPCGGRRGGRPPCCSGRAQAPLSPFHPVFPAPVLQESSMPQYNPPLRDMQFVLHELFDVVSEFKDIPEHAEVDADTINAVLEEGGKFASQVVFPLNISGDAEGCALDKATHEVTRPRASRKPTPSTSKAAGRRCPATPSTAARACRTPSTRLLRDAQQRQPGLDDVPRPEPRRLRGPARARHRRAEEDLPAQAGQRRVDRHHVPDRAALRHRPGPAAHQGRTAGRRHLQDHRQKIFISAGEHDMAENIVHLVLARLPDAPAGSKGISLFVVPKFKVNADGSLGERNPIYCGGLEHKMGIHGNATCQMILDGAVGTLVGQPNKGLQAMFVMMNAARLGVGMQSLGLTEVAYQNAVAYAKDRLQMRALSGPKARTSRPTRSSCTPTCARCC